MKVALIVIGSLLLIGVVYLIVKKNKDAAVLAASNSANSTNVMKPPVLVISAAGLAPAPVYDATSGTVTSSPRPSAVVASSIKTANCKLICDAKYPLNKSKRDACKAGC